MHIVSSELRTIIIEYDPHFETKAKNKALRQGNNICFANTEHWTKVSNHYPALHLIPELKIIFLITRFHSVP